MRFLSILLLLGACRAVTADDEKVLVEGDPDLVAPGDLDTDDDTDADDTVPTTIDTSPFDTGAPPAPTPTPPPDPVDDTGQPQGGGATPTPTVPTPTPVPTPVPTPPPTGGTSSGPIPPGGGIEVISDCTLNERHLVANGPTVRVVGIYETVQAHSGFQQHNPGPGYVHYAVDEPVVLVLSSYEGTDWFVTEDFPGSIQRIIAHGYHPQTVQAPAGVPVDVLGYQTTGQYLWSSIYHWDDLDARDLEDELSNRFGYEVSSFHGCYEGEVFTFQPSTTPNDVEQPTNCAPAGVPDGPRDLTAAQLACPLETSEPEWCLTTTNRGVPSVVGLSSGNVCAMPVPAVTAGFGDDHSIGWGGEWFYSCNEWGKLTRVNLSTGVVEDAYTYCSGAVAYDGGVALLPPSGVFGGGMTWYPSFRDAACQRNGQGFLSTNNSRVGIGEVGAVTAWHSTGSLDLFNPANGNNIGALPMATYNGWIHGLASSAVDRVQVLGQKQFGDEVMTFDVPAGNQLDSVVVNGDIAGLVCVEP